MKNGRVFGALLGLAIMWLPALTGADKPAIAGGLVLGGIVMLASMPRWARIAALVGLPIVIIIALIAANVPG